MVAISDVEVIVGSSVPTVVTVESESSSVTSGVEARMLASVLVEPKSAMVSLTASAAVSAIVSFCGKFSVAVAEFAAVLLLQAVPNIIRHAVNVTVKILLNI